MRSLCEHDRAREWAVSGDQSARRGSVRPKRARSPRDLWTSRVPRCGQELGLDLRIRVWFAGLRGGSRHCGDGERDDSRGDVRGDGDVARYGLLVGLRVRPFRLDDHGATRNGGGSPGQPGPHAVYSGVACSTPTDAGLSTFETHIFQTTRRWLALVPVPARVHPRSIRPRRSHLQTVDVAAIRSPANLTSTRRPRNLRDGGRGPLCLSRDGGSTFLENAVPAIDAKLESAAYIAAVDPQDADRIYLHARESRFPGCSSRTMPGKRFPRRCRSPARCKGLRSRPTGRPSTLAVPTTDFGWATRRRSHSRKFRARRFSASPPPAPRSMRARTTSSSRWVSQTTEGGPSPRSSVLPTLLASRPVPRPRPQVRARRRRRLSARCFRRACSTRAMASWSLRTRAPAPGRQRRPLRPPPDARAHSPAPRVPPRRPPADGSLDGSPLRRGVTAREKRGARCRAAADRPKEKRHAMVQRDRRA